VAHLRKAILEELQRRNLSPITTRIYLRAVEEFAQYYNKPTDRLGPKHIRQRQAHLFTDRKLDAISVAQQLRLTVLFSQDPQASLDRGRHARTQKGRSAYRRPSRGKKWNGSCNALTACCIAPAFLRSTARAAVSVKLERKAPVPAYFTAMPALATTTPEGSRTVLRSIVKVLWASSSPLAITQSAAAMAALRGWLLDNAITLRHATAFSDP